MQFLKFFLSLVVYLAVVITLIFGLIKGLAWWLDISQPLVAVTSGSMWPELYPGDLILIEKIEATKLMIDDIVVYKRPSQGEIHVNRIVELRGQEVVVRGDANFIADETVLVSSILGRNALWRGRPVRIPHAGTLWLIINTSLKNWFKSI